MASHAHNVCKKKKTESVWKKARTHRIFIPQYLTDEHDGKKWTLERAYGLNARGTLAIELDCYAFINEFEWVVY